MKKLFSILILLVVIIAPVHLPPAAAGDSHYDFLSSLESYSYVELTVDNTTGGVGFTAAQLQGVNVTAKRDIKAAIISVEGADIRYREDGGAPTSTVGHLKMDGQEFAIFPYSSLVKFKAIRTGDVSATLRCTLYY